MTYVSLCTHTTPRIRLHVGLGRKNSLQGGALPPQMWTHCTGRELNCLRCDIYGRYMVRLCTHMATTHSYFHIASVGIQRVRSCIQENRCWFCVHRDKCLPLFCIFSLSASLHISLCLHTSPYFCLSDAPSLCLSASPYLCPFSYQNICLPHRTKDCQLPNHFACLTLFISLSVCCSISLSVCLSISLSVFLSNSLSVCLTVPMSVCFQPFCLPYSLHIFVCLLIPRIFVCLPLHFFVCFLIQIFVCLPRRIFFYLLSITLSACLSISLSVYLSMKFVRLSLRIFVCQLIRKFVRMFLYILVCLLIHKFVCLSLHNFVCLHTYP